MPVYLGGTGPCSSKLQTPPLGLERTNKAGEVRTEGFLPALLYHLV